MGDSYKEAVVRDGPEVTPTGIEIVQAGLEPVQAGLEPASQAGVPPGQPRSRRRFIVLIAAAVVVVVVALAVGLGVGLTRSSSSNPSSDATTTYSNTSLPSTQSTSLPSSSSATESTPTPRATLTTTSTGSGTSNASPTSTSIYHKSEKYTCPSANNTELQNVSPNSADSTYYIFCDADIQATNKKDLSSTVQSSFAECLGLCNSMNNYQDRADVALTWNFEGTGQQEPGTCWCVTGSSKRVISNPGNMVAVLVSEDVVVDL